MADASASIEDPGAIEYLVAVARRLRERLVPVVLPPPSIPHGAAQPTSVAAGRGLQHDLEMATALLGEPERPFVAVLGGDNSLLRLHNLQGLVLRADIVVVGGHVIAAAPSSRQMAWRCRRRVSCRVPGSGGLGKRVRHEIQLPTDLVVTRPGGSVEVVEPEAHTEGDVVDIGPLSALRFSEACSRRGPALVRGARRVGDPRFAAGTRAVAGALLESGASAPSSVGTHSCPFRG